MQGRHLYRGEHTQLSPRQLEIVKLVAAGMLDKEIATALWISVSTVKSQLAVIRGKWDANNRAEVAAMAVRKGLAC